MPDEDVLLDALIAASDEDNAQIHAAFDRHCRENHNADYEACQDAQCRSAFALEEQLVAAYIARHTPEDGEAC